MPEREEDQLRGELRAWLRENWDPELSLVAWRERLADSGWGCPSWPEEYFGRGLPTGVTGLVAAELAAVGAVGVPFNAAMRLVAPTVLAHGSDELKHRLLRPIVTGAESWCQLFSEPGSGSDLASLATRAERDGDEWVVSGQKLWTTAARAATYGLMLARTDWDVPKHQGITCFALPMRQKGVEVRPLRQMNGYASFNEVFITEARIPHGNIIGATNNGWAVALTTLAHERGLGAGPPPPIGAKRGRAIREAALEAAEYGLTYVWYPQRAGRADLAVPQAKATGSATDPLVRQAVADLHSLERAARWTAARVASERSAGREPGSEGSISKLAGSEIARRAALVHTTIHGAHAMLTGDGSPLDGIIAEVLVSTPAASIAGGTDEIQHNIIGERALGLPKEPAVDGDVPFKQVSRNQA